MTASLSRALKGRSALTAAVLVAGALAQIAPANASTTFGPAERYPIAYGTRQLVAADFNGDTKLDLAAPDFNAPCHCASSASVLLGDGAGAFAALSGSPFTVGEYPGAIEAGDFNGDLRPDLVVGNSGGTTVSVLLGTIAGTFSSATTHDAGTGGPIAVAVGKFNNDSNADIAVVDQGAPGQIAILIGNGSGGFSSPATLPTGNVPTAIVADNLVGDGAVDLAWTNAQDNTISVAVGNGDGTFGSPTVTGVPANPTAITSDDFNHDSRPDLVVASGGDGSAVGKVSLLIAKSSGGFEAPATFPTAGKLSFGIAVGEIDGDQFDDVVTADMNSHSISVLHGDGPAHLGPAEAINAGASAQPSDVALGDFDKDGHPDIAMADYGPAYLSVFKNIPIPPDTSVASGPTGTTRANSASFSFDSDQPGSTFECKLDAAPWTACQSQTSYSDLPEGSHNLQVRASDPGGNPDPTPATRDWAIDRSTPPTARLTADPLWSAPGFSDT